MVFILGTNFAESRPVFNALRQFYGIGEKACLKLMARHYIHRTARMGSLQNKQILDLTADMSNMTIENDLRRKLVENITRLRDMKSYRGMRHALGYPVRGQRTRNQTRTAWKLNRVERAG